MAKVRGGSGRGGGGGGGGGAVTASNYGSKLNPENVPALRDADKRLLAARASGDRAEENRLVTAMALRANEIDRTRSALSYIAKMESANVRWARYQFSTADAVRRLTGTRPTSAEQARSLLLQHANRIVRERI
jgi:hypothetical protein